MTEKIIQMFQDPEKQQTKLYPSTNSDKVYDNKNNCLLTKTLKDKIDYFNSILSLDTTGEYIYTLEGNNLYIGEKGLLYGYKLALECAETGSDAPQGQYYIEQTHDYQTKPMNPLCYNDGKYYVADRPFVPLHTRGILYDHSGRGRNYTVKLVAKPAPGATPINRNSQGDEILGSWTQYAPTPGDGGSENAAIPDGGIAYKEFGYDYGSGNYGNSSWQIYNRVISGYYKTYHPITVWSEVVVSGDTPVSRTATRMPMISHDGGKTWAEYFE